MTNRRPLLLLGAGSIATNYAEAFRDNPGYEISGYVEDRAASGPRREIEGLPVYSTEDALGMARTHAVIGCIGSPARRALVERFEAAGFEFATLISPAAIVHPKAVIEPGCVISDQTDIDPHTRIGRHSILSAKVSFGHHTTMGPFGFIGPGTMIAGSCTIGEGCYLGMSAAVRDHIVIGDGATIGAGAVVVKDVEPGITVVGNPARPLERSAGGGRRRTAPRKPLLLLGAGGMATTYELEFKDHPAYEIVGFVQDAEPERVGTLLNGKHVYGVEEALTLAGTHGAICAIGTPDRQAMVEAFEKAGFEFATLISPTAIVYNLECLEPGCIVSDFANLDPYIRIGRHTIITSRVTVGHHSTVGPYSLLAPGVTIGGESRIGARCYLGIGAIIRDHITIGDGATVGAGAVVVKDVEDGATVVGVPARPLQKRGMRQEQAGKRRKPLLLLGAGDMAATYVEEFSNDPNYEVVGLVQDADPAAVGEARHGKPVLGVEEALALRRTHAVIGAIGSPERRTLIERFEREGFEFATLISPTAVVHGRDGIGHGCIVCDLANLDPHIHIGRHTIITSGVTVAHHCAIGEFSFVSSGVQFGGNCRVGKDCFIGTGAIIRDHITIGDGATVGAGAVVVRDVEAGVTVAGVPARPLPEKPAKDGKASVRRPVLVLGAGGQAAAWTRKLAGDHPYEIAGYVQSIDPAQGDAQLEGRPVYWIEDALKLSATHAAICMTGKPGRGELIGRFEAAGFEFATIISRLALVALDAKIGPGCVVTEFATIEPFCEIGAHSQILRGSLIGHHSRIGSNCIICAGTTIAGSVRMGDRCFVGIGANVRDHVSIGEGATIGAGAVVVKDIPAGVTVVGNPARSLADVSSAHAPGRRPRQAVLMLGAGEQAASYAENVADHPDFEVVGFVQDVDPDRKVREIEGRPVYFVDDVKDWQRTHKVVCCIGTTKKREMIRKFEAMGFEFATLVATTALISPKAELGPGCFVSHTGQVASFARVGAHTMIGRQTMVGHHSTVGAYCLIAGSAVIGGGAKVGDACFIGMGALIRDHVTLGDNVTVGVGAVVVKDVPSGMTVAGVPARPIEPKD